MKQQITKKQWSELSVEEMVLYSIEVGMLELKHLGHHSATNDYKLVTIGQMIEFLGDDEPCLFIDKYFENTIMDKSTRELAGCYANVAIGWDGEELCDALWEAVKYKLQNVGTSSS